MKKTQASKLLFGAAGLMVLGFLIHVLVDYQAYNSHLNSAPFRLWIYVDALLWLVPAGLAMIAGWIARKKQNGKEKKV